MSSEKQTKNLIENLLEVMEEHNLDLQQTIGAVSYAAIIVAKGVVTRDSFFSSLERMWDMTDAIEAKHEGRTE